MSQRTVQPGSENRTGIARLAWAVAMLAGAVCLAADPAGQAEQMESGSEADTVLRDPLWPIGFAPRRPAEEEAAGLVDSDAVEWPRLPVRGRSRAGDGSHRVLVDRVGIVREGEVVSLPHDGLWFHWRITKIDDQGVTSTRLGVSEERAPRLLRRPSDTTESEYNQENEQ